MSDSKVPQQAAAQGAATNTVSFSIPSLSSLPVQKAVAVVFIVGIIVVMFYAAKAKISSSSCSIAEQFKSLRALQDRLLARKRASRPPGGPMVI